MKPLISFQGKKDQVFPYDLGVKQNIYFSTVPAFNSTDFCINSSHGAYFLDTSAPSRDLVNGSTLNMRNILIHYKIADEHYVDPDMLHGFTTDTLGVFHGDFGTGVTNSTDACVYLAQRIATFFQAVLNTNATNANVANLGTNYFSDCPNTRVKCSAKTTTCP